VNLLDLKIRIIREFLFFALPFTGNSTAIRNQYFFMYLVNGLVSYCCCCQRSSIRMASEVATGLFTMNSLIFSALDKLKKSALFTWWPWPRVDNRGVMRYYR